MRSRTARLENEIVDASRGTKMHLDGLGWLLERLRPHAWQCAHSFFLVFSQKQNIFDSDHSQKRSGVEHKETSEKFQKITLNASKRIQTGPELKEQICEIL